MYKEEEIWDIIYNDHEDFKEIKEEIYDQRRWVTCYSKIVQNINNQKYYKITYEIGSTEYQEGSNQLHGMDEVFESFEVIKTFVTDQTKVKNKLQLVVELTELQDQK